MSKADMDRFRFEVVPRLKSRQEIAAELRERKRQKVAALSQETKQKVLDLLNKSKSIGEVKEELNLDLDEVCGVINQNIKTADRLRRVAVNTSAEPGGKNES